MSQRILENPANLNVPEINLPDSTLKNFLPAALSIAGSLLMVLGRIQMGGDRFISDGALMMLALACYLTAAVFHLTNIYAPSNVAEKLGMWSATLGVFFNLSSWLVRWVAAYDRELDILAGQGRAGEIGWVFRFVPFANLYDLSLAFAFGAGITTLLVAQRKHFRLIAALALPIAALILILARFIGNEFIDLPPVLDSYWRPIHVGIASLSYGIALVCFAVAVLYLLKDGVKPQAMAIWSSIFGIAVFATISKFSIYTPSTFFQYTASAFWGTSRSPLGLRADIPYAGLFIGISGILLSGVVIAYLLYLQNNSEPARKIGHNLLRLAFITQLISVIVLAAQVRGIQDVAARINPNQYERFAVWMGEQEGLTKTQIMQQRSPAELANIGQNWVRENGSQLRLSLNANPVEFAALLTALAGTMFALIFGFRTEKLREALPSAERLDSVMYKLGGVTFAGLALLLMTGAIWANESWGRYWGWDSKETGAFVAWLTYGAFLHARISRGMVGRRCAYFAVIAFLFVIFTYLGVSYLLPGLHSYA
jgi:ABC-type transport system involved in cytochrome c biogenesis permease subunit